MSFIKNTVNPLLSNHLKRASSSISNISNISNNISNGEKFRVMQSDRLESNILQSCRVKEVSGLILDWSGTVTDRYVIAPAIVFVDSFKHFGVDVTMQEARLPMGLRKDLHIKAMTEMKSVREKWHKVHNRYPTDQDVQDMYAYFIPKQLECLDEYSELLPGVAKITQSLQKSGLLIGTSTGFSKEMVDILAHSAKKQGYTPDVVIAGDDVLNGARPDPHMIFKNMDLLNISNPQSLIKVDDTAGGIGEGLNAGCWTVGVSKWSNYVDVDSFLHERILTDKELEIRRASSRNILLKSGAHYVIDDINSLPEVINDINSRMDLGETPINDLLNQNKEEGISFSFGS